jgi:hypothetical protein
MKRIIAALAATSMMLVGGGMANAQAPSQGGFSTDNVTYKGFLPFEVGSSTGVTIQGKWMYLTSWKNISIYDITDPLNPVQTAVEPVGFMFENENVAVSPGGEFLLFSESLPNDILHIYNIEDKTDIVPVAEVEGAGDHTTSCILKCKWAYGSDGAITDLRNPAKPKQMVDKDGNELDWRAIANGQPFDNHDITEVKNGFLLTTPINGPFHYMDVRNPLKPKILALGEKVDEGWLFHSGEWPRGGKDDIILMQGEQNAETRCSDTNGPIMTYDARNWKKSKTFKRLDVYRVQNGTYTDGSPAVNGLGCSAHWFESHPTFNNGGLVAVGYYEHGTRFFDVDSKGKIKEVGWFLPHAGSTSAAYWVSEKKDANIVYSVDYTRGLDILEWTGDF